MPNFFPESEFVSPASQAPPPGYEAGRDYDPSQYFGNHAESGNESRTKLQDLLRKLAPYEEISISTSDGRRVKVLAQYLGLAVGIGLPFEVTLKNKGTDKAPDYVVTVNDGRIVERVMTTKAGDDGIIYHECSNHRDDNDKLVEFPVDESLAVFVQALENEVGTLKGGEDIKVVIADRYTTKTQIHIPGVQQGAYFYKLAEFDRIDGELQLVNFAAGSHIHHKSGLTCDVRILQCPTFDGGSMTEGSQLMRLSFVSGSIVSVGEPVSARGLSETVHEIAVEHCT
jgi:hypothetical protein